MTRHQKPRPHPGTADRPGLGPEPPDHTPNAARVYDALLGGSANFAADRAAAANLLNIVPTAEVEAHANRDFLHRAVRYLLAAGIRQFIDLGCGLPGPHAVHHIAHEADPDARVVYVDNDPVVTEYSRQSLADTPHVAVLHADLCAPLQVLASAEVLDLLDLTKPVGLLAVAVLHFVSDTYEPDAILATYRAALAPGSHLVLSHATGRNLLLIQSVNAGTVYDNTPTPLTLRSAPEIRDLFDGWALLPAAIGEPPAVVPVSAWRSMDDLAEPDPHARNVLGGVAYLPDAHQW